MGKILDGKQLAQKLNSELKENIDISFQKTGIKPKLGVILVGEDPSSIVYIKIKQKICEEVGIESELTKLENNTTRESLIKEIEKFNADSTIHGILLQLPLPKQLEDRTSEFIELISPLKDVDGLHPINKGHLFDYYEDFVPCTPKGIIKLLEYNDIIIRGKDVVIINRSNLVGKPLIFMFLKRNATITVCHTSTENIESHMKRADILIVAVGHPNFVTKEKIKEGVVIIDVGTNRVDGKLCGDVDFDGVFDKCSRISPSPGGVGPLTVAYLMQNTFLAYKKQLKIE